MAKLLLGVTGSVAAIHTPTLFAELTNAGHEVRVVATARSLHFFDPLAFARTPEGERDRAVVSLDEDEWRDYRRGDPVLHIELRRWADALLIAPLDAHTLGKLAGGLCDNCLTCVVRAWDRTRPLIVAPAMNTLMWEHPATARHLAQLAADVGPRFALVPPITKRLACDDVGPGALADRADLLAAVARALAT